jgi:predicted neutral ceramidase superfamily lipid hydrolase
MISEGGQSYAITPKIGQHCFYATEARRIKMPLPHVIALALLISLVFFTLPYYLTNRFRKSKISKFIPSLLCLVSILVLAMKVTFFRVGYSSIADVVFIITFSLASLILFLIALLINPGISSPNNCSKYTNKPVGRLRE